MRKKIIVSLSIISILILCSTIIYGYFYKALDSSNPHNFSQNISNGIIEINSLDEFYQAITYQNSTANNTNISSKDERITIKVNVDLTLTTDVSILRDAHLYLNNVSIDLNGYTLEFKNKYDGLFMVYGIGTFKDSTGTNNIYLDVPNAYVLFSDTIKVLDDISIIEKNISDSVLVNTAMNYIVLNLVYAGIGNINSLIGKELHYNQQLCSFEHKNITDYCLYTYTDLLFEYNYFNHRDLNITYKSSDTNVLSDTGNIKGQGQAILSISISYKNLSITKTITVHSVSEAEYAKASLINLQSYLYVNYFDDTENKYVFKTSFMIPRQNEYFNQNYTITLNSGLTSEIIINDTNLSDYFDIFDTYYVLYLNSDITNMVLTSSNGSVSYASDVLPVNATSSKLIDDNYSYVLNFVVEEIGNQLMVYDDSTFVNSGYTEYDLPLNAYDLGYTRIKSISYSLVSNDEATYKLETSDNYVKLSVSKDGVLPYLGQNVFISILATFHTDETITIQIPITYAVRDTGEGLDYFASFYTYFNNQFVYKTNNYTYNSFNLPFAYQRNLPTYTFIVYEKNSDGSFKRVPTSDGLFTIYVVSGSSTIQIDDLTSINLNNFIKNSNTEVLIKINPYYINKIDTEYYFAYVPIYQNASNYYYDLSYTDENGIYQKLNFMNLDDVEANLNSRIDSYEYISHLTIPGIVRYQNANSIMEEAFESSYFYLLVYEILHFDSAYVDGKTFIQSTRLTQKIDEIVLTSSNSNSSLSTYISSLKGINLLTGLVKLTLTGFNFPSLGENWPINMTYISEIVSLKSLNLSNTAIYDQAESSNTFPTGTSNEFLRTLSNLNNLETLDLSNNKIYNFEALTNFPSLKTVNVTNNVFEATSSSFDWFNNIFEGIVNSMYGSSGSINQATYAILIANGVTVTLGDSSITLTDDQKKIISALTSLLYQDKLSQTQSIEDAYKYIDLSNIINYLTNTFIIENGDTRVKYVFNEIGFSYDSTADSKFIFHIKYSISYSTKNIFGGWSAYKTDNLPTTIIDYNFTYSVYRY